MKSPLIAKILPAKLFLFVLFCLPVFRTSAEDPADIIDRCDYGADAAAQAAWKPMDKATMPALAGVANGRNVLRLPCDFSAGIGTRSSWDRKVKLDLSSTRGIQFDFLCRKTLPVSYFSIYLQSGQGWYHALFFPESATDWNTITVDKADMKPEGKPDGWDQIKTIRISAWRSGTENTELFISDIRRTKPAPQPGTAAAAQEAIDTIGNVASFKSYEAAAKAIGTLGVDDKRVAPQLLSAATQRDTAIKLAAGQKFTEATDQAVSARKQLKLAYCMAQPAEPGEFRAFWCHSVYGVPGMDWDEAIRRLAENGFTAIVPNMLAGGVAFYDSKVLPVDPKVATRGDQIKQCVAACKKYGIKIYVWKLDWNLGGATPKSFVEKMRNAHRLQMSSTGKEELWLCPSDPDNQKLETDAMLEIVHNYDVNGIHFDYIRYPDIDHCFCDRCRERFQKSAAVTVKNWPADALEGGPLRQQWQDWRRSNITRVVKSISEQARAFKPAMEISAAVFRYWNTDRNAVGQDWKVWCDKGYLDFVCPMDYTPSKARFQDMVSQQVQWAGKARCYPGLGVSSSSSHFDVDRAIEEINITRQNHTHGFIIFNYGAKESADLLPQLGLGITRPPAKN